MRHFAVSFTLAVIIGIGDCAIAQTVPHTFTPGAVIRATELNENFKALASASASSSGAVKMVIGGGQIEIGVVLGFSYGLDRVPQVFGLTSKNYQFWLAPIEQRDAAGERTAYRLTIDSRSFTDIVYRSANCQGIAYIYEFDPSARYYIENGFLVSDGTKILMMNPGNPITLFTPISRTNSAGACSPVPSTEPARRYVQLNDNNFAITGFPTIVPSGPMNFSLQR